LFLSYRFKQGQTYTKSGHGNGGHTALAGFFVCGMMCRFGYEMPFLFA